MPVLGQIVSQWETGRQFIWQIPKVAIYGYHLKYFSVILATFNYQLNISRQGSFLTRLAADFKIKV